MQGIVHASQTNLCAPVKVLDKNANVVRACLSSNVCNYPVVCTLILLQCYVALNLHFDFVLDANVASILLSSQSAFLILSYLHFASMLLSSQSAF